MHAVYSEAIMIEYSKELPFHFQTGLTVKKS